MGAYDEFGEEIGEYDMSKIRVGFVGFGEVNTPREFIDERCAEAGRLLEQQGVELVQTAPVSDDPEGVQASRAVRELKSGGEFDLLIVCVAGWIPSWAVFAVIEPFKHKPILLWGLTGWQEGDRFITTADQAGTTALRKPMADMGYTFKYVVTYRGQPPRIDEIMNYARAAHAVAQMKTAKIGMAGYRDMRLYGTMYDGISLKAQIGPEIEHFELLELAQMIGKVDRNEVSRLAQDVRKRWTFIKEPKPGTVEKSVELYLAISGKIKERGYQGFSFNDVDGIKKLLGFAPAGAMTLLHDEMDISSVPENDSLGAVTQLMVRLLTGQVAAYLEFYEFIENGALMGVPDYVPSEIVDGKVTVMPNAFGNFGEGLLNVSKLKTGLVTLARLGYANGLYCMHITTAEARTPRKWEEAGWAPPAPQLPSLEMIFDYPVEEFVQKVMSQHYILSYGDNRGVLKELCAILKIGVTAQIPACTAHRR
jgi:L-fucose isomerase-like protein